MPDELLRIVARGEKEDPKRLRLRSSEALYVCPTGNELKKYHRSFPKRDGLTKDGTMIYFARKQDCHAYTLKSQCHLQATLKKSSA